MSHLPHQDKPARKEWWDVFSENIEIANDSLSDAKMKYLASIYSELYQELRAKEQNQQQVVTWALVILTGSGIGGISIGSQNLLVILLFSLSLLLVTIIMTDSVAALVSDRMSISRQLDRCHKVMGGFTPSFYYKGATLIDPIWYGWGFEKERDSNYLLGSKYQKILWVLCATDIFILLSSKIA